VSARGRGGRPRRSSTHAAWAGAAELGAAAMAGGTRSSPGPRRRRAGLRPRPLVARRGPPAPSSSSARGTQRARGERQRRRRTGGERSG
jgi:hypothetical protein